jgi:hypothetical protein
VIHRDDAILQHWIGVVVAGQGTRHYRPQPTEVRRTGENSRLPSPTKGVGEAAGIGRVVHSGVSRGGAGAKLLTRSWFG